MASRRPRHRGFDQQLVMIVGTHRGVGKSTLAGAMAAVIRQMGIPIGVFKPVSIACRSSRHGLVSRDVEFLAHCADSPFSLSEVNPYRFRGTFPPIECSRRENRWIDPSELDAALERVRGANRVTLIEGVGGIAEPLDEQMTALDLAKRWNARLILVASASMEQISHLLAACDCMKKRMPPSAIVLNRYDPEQATLAEEVNPEWLASYLGMDKPYVLPPDPETKMNRGVVGKDAQAAVLPLVNWLIS